MDDGSNRVKLGSERTVGGERNRVKGSTEFKRLIEETGLNRW